MSCHEPQRQTGSGRKILLMGNPNVGKSVIFSRLTGVEVESSNYAGTTIDYSTGKLFYRGQNGILIDVPGTYSLEATSPAEEVAVKLLKEGAEAIICVLDATNLSRNLDLALQLKTYGIPTIFALNLTDISESRGIHIDLPRLSELLGAPVIPTVAIRNQGLQQLLDSVWQVSATCEPLQAMAQQERWEQVERIIAEVEKHQPLPPTLLERWGDLTLRPFPGGIIAILVMALSVGMVVGGGKALRALILLPLINNYVVPFFTWAVSSVIGEGLIRNLLIGEYGVLIKGVEWPFALILPYVLLFYIVFSLLEDSGYLPRLGVLADAVLKRVGVQGGNIIPIMMGYGCAVPAILGTRAAVTKKERLIVTSIVAFAVPCASQSAAFFSLLGEGSVWVLVTMYAISFLVIGLVGVVLGRLIPGQNQPLLLEIPHLLIPDWTAMGKKLKMRLKHFLVEAEVPMFLGILLAAVIVETGLFNTLSGWLEPVVSVWLGLPAESSLSLLLGIIRRELAVLPLLELDLTGLQLLVGSTVALFYLPCLSVFAVIAREFSFKVALGIGLATTISAFLFGGLVFQIGRLVLLLV